MYINAITNCQQRQHKTSFTAIKFSNIFSLDNTAKAAVLNLSKKGHVALGTDANGFHNYYIMTRLHSKAEKFYMKLLNKKNVEAVNAKTARKDINMLSVWFPNQHQPKMA